MMQYVWRQWGWRKKQRHIYDRLPKEWKALHLFVLLFLVLLMRLFALQVINGERYTNILVQQHFTKSTLKAERGHVFMVDSAGKPVQLTENVELFTLYVDPKFVLDKPRMISFLTPLMYQHFCMEYGIHEPDMLTCVKNIEAFSATRLLPEKQYAFYYSGDEQVLVDDEKYDTEVAAVLS